MPNWCMRKLTLMFIADLSKLATHDLACTNITDETCNVEFLSDELFTASKDLAHTAVAHTASCHLALVKDLGVSSLNLIVETSWESFPLRHSLPDLVIVTE